MIALAIMFCFFALVYTAMWYFLSEEIRQLKLENERLRTNFATEAQAYQYGISVGITKSLSGKYFQLITDGVTLKRIAMIMDEDKLSN